MYEGIKVGTEQTALITYPRTDSIRMSDSFKAAARKLIKSQYGDEYVNPGERAAKKAGGNIQDAHECIRVIDPFLFPSSLKKAGVKKEYCDMYELI